MNRKLAELTTEELREKRKYHEVIIKIIDNELTSRNVDAIKKINIVSKMDVSKKQDTTKKTDVKKKQATRTDMMVILDKKDIKYKKNSTKQELQDIVRKNNLVRVVDEYSQNKE